QIEIPYSLLSALITSQGGQESLSVRYRVPEKYILKPAFNSVINNSYNIVTHKASVDNEKTTELEDPFKPEEPSITSIMSDKPLQILFGHDAVRQDPLYWEPTNTAKFMNTNTGIIGTMGTGKTQFTKSLVTQLMRTQTCNVDGKSIGLLIFDYKSDYVDEAFLHATNAR